MSGLKTFVFMRINMSYPSINTKICFLCVLVVLYDFKLIYKMILIQHAFMPDASIYFSKFYVLYVIV